MDELTADYYAHYARTLATRYEAIESPVAKYFAATFPEGARVLDVGAGTGRDAAALLKAGYDAHAVEPAAALREAALEVHPELAERLTAGSLPRSGQPFGGQFDGVLCSAVLTHVPEAELFDTAFAPRALCSLAAYLVSPTLALGRVGLIESEPQLAPRLQR